MSDLADTTFRPLGPPPRFADQRRHTSPIEPCVGTTVRRGVGCVTTQCSHGSFSGDCRRARWVVGSNGTAVADQGAASADRIEGGAVEGRHRAGSADLRFRTAPPPAGEGRRTERFSDTIFSGRPFAICGPLMMDRTRQLTSSGCRQPGPRRKRSSLGTALPCSRTGITTAVASWRRVGQRAGAQALHVVSWHGTRPPRKSARRADRETGPRGR